jgi:YVTN family beta-propeller protein
MADAESSRILRKQNCVLTEATKELAATAVRVPTCSSCPLPITAAPVPPYQDCSSTIPVGNMPDSIAISPDSLTAWVANDGESAKTVSRIDQTTNEVIKTIDLNVRIYGIAIDPSNTYVWVATVIGVFRIEIATDDVSGPITVGFNPSGIAVSADNSTVWVSNNGDNTVSYIDTATLNVSLPIPVGLRPRGLVVSPTTVYVVNNRSNTVSCINTITHTVDRDYPVGRGPINIAISPDNSKLWIINYTDSTISVLDSATGALLKLINLPQANGIAISPDYSSVWVTRQFLNTVTHINALTYVPISTVNAGLNTSGVAINPDNSAVLIVNSTSNTVTKLYIPSPPPSFLVEGLLVPSSGIALLTLTILHGRAVDLTSYVRAVDGSPLTFILPLNLGGAVEINGSILTAYQTTPYLPITVTTSSSCTQEQGSMILNIVLTVPAFVTPSESNYTLSHVTACPVYILNQIPPNPCKSLIQGTLSSNNTFSPTPLNPYPYVTTPPDDLHQYRSLPRIRGIDQITKVVRGQSSSEATTRKQTAVLRGHVASTNPFFRKPIPPPPCPTRFVPQPPYQPSPPCRVKPL